MSLFKLYLQLQPIFSRVHHSLLCLFLLLFLSYFLLFLPYFSLCLADKRRKNAFLFPSYKKNEPSLLSPATDFPIILSIGCRFKQNHLNRDFSDYRSIIPQCIIHFHSDRNYFRQPIQVGNISAVCSVYTAEFISVYFIESLLNLRMPFINNYSAPIVTSNTFALQTPQ